MLSPGSGLRQARLAHIRLKVARLFSASSRVMNSITLSRVWPPRPAPNNAIARATAMSILCVKRLRVSAI